MKYEMCAKLGLKVSTMQFDFNFGYKDISGRSVDKIEKGEPFGLIRADDVERLLADGVNVYGFEAIDLSKTNSNRLQLYSAGNTATHSGYLIAYKELQKPKSPVTRAEVEEAYRNTAQFTRTDQLLKRILSDGYEG